MKPLNQVKPNLAGMVPGWVPFKIVSVNAILYPRWPPLLKIKMSSNGQNCSIVSQNVPKFELYNGMKFKKKSSPLKLLSQPQPNFDEMILGWSSSKIVSSISEHRPRWPPQPNLI